MALVQDYNVAATRSLEKTSAMPSVTPVWDAQSSTTERGLQILKILNEVFDRTDSDNAGTDHR